jgi:hypothetical protein
MDLTDVITLTLEDVNDLKLVNGDGSYASKPLNHHVRKLKALLLLYYKQKCMRLSSTLDEEDVLNMTKTEFIAYCGSPGNQNDLSTGLQTQPN